MYFMTQSKTYNYLKPVVTIDLISGIQPNISSRTSYTLRRGNLMCKYANWFSSLRTTNNTKLQECA